MLQQCYVEARAEIERVTEFRSLETGHDPMSCVLFRHDVQHFHPTLPTKQSAR
jgi:hypothetical protein